jgi:ABC-type multidrug transport system ATPase subunit
MRMLQTLNGEGSTIVMVTHSPAHADYAGRIVSMLDGRILQERRRRGLTHFGEGRERHHVAPNSPIS